MADATQVTDINYSDAGVNVDQAALILQGTDCTIPDSSPSSPFSAVVYKFTAHSTGDITVTIGSPSGTSTVIFYTADNLNATTGSELSIISTCGTRTSGTIAASLNQSYYVAIVNTGGATDINFSGDASLPVELISFSAEKLDNSVRLLWKTATEVNNYGFEIERKIGEVETEWETQGFVEGNGNSNSPKSYEFVDKNPPSGSLKYRLKQIDNDGQYDYYGTTAEVINYPAGEEQFPKDYSLFQNYPNPFNPSTKIRYGIPEISNVKLEVFNLIGERVSLLIDTEEQPGYYSVSWDAKTLPSGIYLIRLSVESNSTHKRFIKIKKAALLK